METQPQNPEVRNNPENFRLNFQLKTEPVRMYQCKMEKIEDFTCVLMYY